MERAAKRQKIAACLSPQAVQLVDLPCDILDHICLHLSTVDLCNVSMVSHQLRDKLLPSVFASVKGTWEQIIDLQTKAESTFTSKEYVRSLRITSCNSFNEYKQNTFGLLLSPQMFPNLVNVSVNSINLSYWLKYNRCSHVRALTLYCNNVFRGVKIFQLSHVDDFAHLRLLCLHNYHFNWETEDFQPKVGLKELVLHDCTWEYPFDLANFNLDDTLQELTITYSNNNSFTLLERFISFVNDPFRGHSDSLLLVNVSFVDITENKKLLSPTVLQAFIDCFTGIESLTFCGWTTNLNYLKSVLVHHHFEYPVVLTLNVESVEEVNLNSFLETMGGIPNLKLRVTQT